MQNNNFHSSIVYITLLAYHPTYQDIEVVVGDSPSQKAYKHLKSINSVIDVVEIKYNKKEGNYFIIVEKVKRAHVKATIGSVIQAFNVRLQNQVELTVMMKHNKYTLIQSGVSARGYLEQSIAQFAVFLLMYLLPSPPLATLSSLLCYSKLTKLRIFYQ